MQVLLSVFDRSSSGAMKVWEIFVCAVCTNNSPIKSTMKLFDAVLESLSQALSRHHKTFGFPSWNHEKIAPKVVEFCYVCYFI